MLPAKEFAALRAWFGASSPYGWMLAADVAIGLAVLASRIAGAVPQNPYSHLLATYEFGFTRRALLGEVASWFADRVSPGAMYAVGATVLLVALGLYVAVFQRTVGLRARAGVALFCFTAGSPFFFKNFLFAIGFLDVYGCIVALLALLLPLRALSSAALALLAAALLLLHHIHFLLYLPTIALVWALRLYAGRKPTPGEAAAWAGVGLFLAGVFFLVMFAGAPPVAPERFLAALQARATIPVDAVVTKIWYSTLRGEWDQTWGYLPQHLARLPVFLLLLALHLPFWRVFRDDVRRLDPRLRHRVIAGLVGITAGYGAICVTNYDWSRWFSSFFVCAVMVFHAVRSIRPTTEPAIEPDRPRTQALAAAVTALPRVGVIFPF